MKEPIKTDLVVIGGGPGGYVAAIRAAQLGLKVILVEKQHLGGICLNWGCIPTKALLKSAEVNHLIQNSQKYGITVGSVECSFSKIIQRSRDVAAKLSSGIKHLMKKNKIEVLDGHAKFVSSRQIEVKINGEESEAVIINTNYTIVATGASPRALKGFEPDENLVWTYKKAMTPDRMPESIIVVGSGAIGVEFASFYRNMGCKVTILEAASRILPAEDIEIADIARKYFEKSGIKIYTKIQLKNLSKLHNSVTVSLVDDSGKQHDVSAERIIMAVGVIGNVENAGLENTKVEVAASSIKTNGFCQTKDTAIYAIGDVASAPLLAHKASHEGVIAAEKVAASLNVFDGSHVKPIIKENIAGCTYCTPQIASVGLTEEKAIAQGIPVRIGKFPYSANGKAIAAGEEEFGLVKTIFHAKTGELLGAHIVGAEATEMIQGFIIAKTAQLTQEDLAHTIFPHPTLSEMMHESTLNALEMSLHI